MNVCPKCNSTLPDWAQQCQFCGAPVTPVARPSRDAGPARSNYAFGIAKWVWVMYYVIASYFVLSGLLTVGVNTHDLIQWRNNEMDQTIFRAFDFQFYVGFGLGAAAIAVGLGLLFQSDFIRGIANVYCCLMALGGIWSTMTLMAIQAKGIGASILLARSVLDIVFGLLMIYFIFETNDNSGF